eukprot:NODE_19737_length_829_cov_8.413105.p5 GENE.NODE_19737_length_829_cov_8.413105~~NODE_19737_length_829_cov_8.413105.p5  ORF type:complete len:71 (-),score=28.49 NODE_19737_length_829_cov_8.413105:126-338(-)
MRGASCCARWRRLQLVLTVIKHNQIIICNVMPGGRGAALPGETTSLPSTCILKRKKKKKKKKKKLKQKKK